MTAVHHQPAQPLYGPPAPPPRGRLRRGWLVAGTTMIVLAVLLPLTVIALVWQATEAADERAEEVGPGLVRIIMRAGHDYDVLTAAPGTVVESCHVLADDDDSGTSVPVTPGTSRLGTQPDEGERGDGLPPGEWFVAGHFTGPAEGSVMVGCDGAHAAGELTLRPDDDSYVPGGLAVFGGGVLLLAGIGALLLGLLWRKPPAAPGFAMAQHGPVLAPSPPPGYLPQPAPGYAPPPSPTPAPWEQQRAPASWESAPQPQPPPAPVAEPWQPQQQWQPPQQEWKPREWQPPQWTPPGEERAAEPDEKGRG
jgi:hypothetical protein